MTRYLTGTAVLIAFATIAEAILAGVEPSWRDISIRAYVFAVGALATMAAVSAADRSLRRARRSAFDAALAGAAPAEHIGSELERLEREVTVATTSGLDFHRRLLPELREIAQARLERTGKHAGPDTLGRWWDLLRPDGEPPPDRSAPGIPADELRALVHDLERLP